MFDEFFKHITYDPASGIFLWAVPTSNRVRVGSKAGHLHGTLGYVQIRWKRKLYYAHRLAFIFMTGKEPPEQVDHINGDRQDNRWSNLRAVTASQNQKNAAMSRNNTSGFVGVHWDKAKSKWCAAITHNYKEIFLGYFDDINHAAASRTSAEAKYGFHPNHGRT